ncbi:ComEC/Rec2 family competence protein [Psychroflexus montanilacus]|uniref:ComEC/Rec2 family competence protein n=1 Tax=Psychroflexus montanilacus TaxID=2873598 RepID=UPI002AFFD38D|nr:ComEC/Rec2 family competence protein [Psychroflexus montanilacus]
MMKYANLSLLQVCIVFFIGIWLGFTDFGFTYSVYFYLSLSLFVLFIISFLMSRSHSKLKLVFSSIALLLVCSLGLIKTKTHLPKHQKAHFTHKLPKVLLQDEYISFEGKVVKTLKPNAYKDKFEVDLQSLNGQAVSGKVLFQIPVSSGTPIKSNSKLSGFGQLKAFQDPQNPQQFNYKDYMATQQMSHVIDSKIHEIVVEKQAVFSFVGLGEKARQNIKESLQNHNFTKEQMGIIQALLLGQKQDIDPETYDRFSKAGVVHILAVSGLHVGIILIILRFLSRGFLRFKHGRFYRGGFVLVGIWGFATLAGFSPSVLRAAVMFSFLSFALNNRRKTSAINTLAMSAVFLLMFNPYFIFQVGFQLSYLAVVSIVTLQSRLSKIYRPKFWLDRKIWDIITVTITAQLGVLPLSLYYFHQFPGLFILSNLLILPGLGILLGGGILMILLSLTDSLPDFLSSLYGYLLDLLLAIVNWISSKEDLVFSDIYFTKSMLITSILLLFSLILWNSRRKLLSYSLLNLSLLAVIVITHLEFRNQLQQKEHVIFQTYRTSQLGILNGSFLNLYSDKTYPKDSIMGIYHIKNYKTLKGVDTVELKGFKSIYKFNEHRAFFVLDSTAVYPKQGFEPYYVLLKNSPNINLDRVISEIKPKQIIADGSNYKSDVERWQNTARTFNVKFHSTWENGAFIFPKD